MSLINRYVILLLWIDLLVRSIDYASGGLTDSDDGLGVPEVWGIAGLTACAVVAAGMLASSTNILKFGSVAAFAVYTMLTIQTFTEDMLPYPWPPEGIRIAFTNAVSAGLWLTVAVALWWREYINEKVDKEAPGDRAGDKGLVS